MASDSYPLSWPSGVPRCKHPAQGRFRVTPGNARGLLMAELMSLGADYVVLSTNVPLRRDGLPYADGDPEDSGVAIYFRLGGKPHTMTCDRWNTVCANMQALALTIQAMRGIARWGSTEMRDQAFAGFQALPPSGSDWRSIFHVSPGERVTLDTVKSMFRARALREHPDVGGSNEAMAKLNEAMAAAEKELGG